MSDRPAKRILVMASLALSLGAAGAQGGVITGVTGNIVDGGALPASLTPNAVESPNGLVFFEGTTTLAADVTVDGGGTIAAGTTVAIHLFHFDPIIPDGMGFVGFDAEGTVTFDMDVLGVASSAALLAASDNLAGTSTSYTPFLSRQFEPAGGSPDSISFVGAMVTVDAFNASNNSSGASFDQARIFVAVPEPASMAVAAIGSLALFSGRRRRR
ncbi:MAG: PEP-CTERM sorting domain-containing protein [Planctomycetota bacterium]